MPFRLANFLTFAVCCVLIAGVLPGARGGEQTDWEAISGLQERLNLDPPAGQNSVEYAAPIEEKLHAAAGAFARDYPGSTHRWDAALLELKTVFFPTPPDERRAVFAEQERKLATLANDPGASEAVKMAAERAVVRQRLDHLDLVETPAEAGVLEARVAALIARNPTDPKLAALQLRRLDLLAKIDPVRSDALLNSLADDPDPKVASAARGRVARQALGQTALDWNFTDVAGNAFRAEQYRGKVVVVEFWASWCPDCLREMPKVREAYQRYHARGLEIVGVSLDKDKEALTGFTKKHALPWPQYFDGKGWDNDLAVRYGVRGIPELWVVDQSGRVVATGLHGDDLDARVTRLLAP